MRTRIELRRGRIQERLDPLWVFSIVEPSGCHVGAVSCYLETHFAILKLLNDPKNPPKSFDIFALLSKQWSDAPKDKCPYENIGAGSLDKQIQTRRYGDFSCAIERPSTKSWRQ